MSTDTLTREQLARGYVQRWINNKPTNLRNVVLHLWYENGAYHVRAHDHDTRGRIFWDSFRTMTQARKRFSSAKPELRALT